LAPRSRPCGRRQSRSSRSHLAVYFPRLIRPFGFSLPRPDLSFLCPRSGLGAIELGLVTSGGRAYLLTCRLLSPYPALCTGEPQLSRCHRRPRVRTLPCTSAPSSLRASIFACQLLSGGSPPDRVGV
jgi:hypothetical protein